MILTQSGQIELEDLPDAVLAGAPWAAPAITAETSRRAMERREGNEGALHEIDDELERIHRALEIAEGNRERAASMLGMSRTTLWRRMKASGVSSGNAES